MLDPAVETRPWDEQLRQDNERYRRQIGYLLDRSPFYRRKLDDAAFTSARFATCTRSSVSTPRRA